MVKEQPSVSSPKTIDGILVDKTSLQEVAEMTEAMTEIDAMEHKNVQEKTMSSFSQQPLKQDLVDDLLKELDL